MGRKSTFTQEIADKICERLSTGEPLVQIYALLDPSNGEIRYIGKANDALKRLKSHMRDSRVRDTPVYRWIRKLASCHMEPDIIVLSECKTGWQDEEIRLIASARARGLKLLNVADGGDQPKASIVTNRANAYALNARMTPGSLERRVQQIKRQIATGLRYGQVPESARIILRKAAEKCPQKFGEYALL